MGLLSSVGDAISSGVGAVGDAVEGALGAAGGAIQDAANYGADTFQGWLGGASSWLCDHGGAFVCGAGSVVLGGIGGLIEGVRDIVGKVGGIITSLGGFFGSLLRGDFAGAIGSLGSILAQLVDLALSVVRVMTLGTIIGGMVDMWQMNDLREFVRDLVEERFSDNPPRLGRILEHLRLRSSMNWGLPIRATNRVFVLDSGVLPLREWHEDGTIDLYQLAGLFSTSSFTINRRRTEVRVANTDGTITSSIPANRSQITRFLNGGDVRLFVYALGRAGVVDVLGVARRKARKLGIKLSWNDEALGTFERPEAHVVQDPAHFSFVRNIPASLNRDGLGRFLIEEGYRRGTAREQTELLAFACFKFDDGGLGVTGGRAIDAGPDVAACPPGRDDSCCVTLVGQRAGRGAGVMYEDRWPPVATKYVLAHEIGHYFGLCHYGHDGLHQIMFTGAEEADLGWTTWGTLLHYYLHDEPAFTHTDAKNVWRFLVDQMPFALEGLTEPMPPEPDPLV